LEFTENAASPENSTTGLRFGEALKIDRILSNLDASSGRSGFPKISRLRDFSLRFGSRPIQDGVNYFSQLVEHRSVAQRSITLAFGFNNLR
jgi:hypothetical protein